MLFLFIEVVCASVLFTMMLLFKLKTNGSIICMIFAD